jgi:hypothetical protein
MSILPGIHILPVFKIGSRRKTVRDRLAYRSDHSGAIGDSLALNGWHGWSVGKIRVLVRVLGFLKGSRVDEAGIFGEFNMDEV